MKERYLYGVKLNERDLETGYLSYSSLAKMVDMVLCNSITDLDGFNEALYEQYFCQVHDEVDLMDEDELNEAFIEAYGEDDEDYDEDDRREYLKEDRTQSLEVYQYYIVNDDKIIKEFTNDLVVYYEPLDIYVWCITHWGTSWSHVSTGTKLIDIYGDDYKKELQEYKGYFDFELLTKDQLTELKQGYYVTEKNEGNGTSYGELAAIDELVSDKEVQERYKDTIFTKDDFFTSNEEI